MSVKSLVVTGTKVWLDSIMPSEVKKNFARGITGATSNPTIIGEIISTGDFDHLISQHIEQGLDDTTIAWQMTDYLVLHAQKTFRPIWDKTHGNDGYVSFELDPLLEDTAHPIPHAQRVAQYKALAARWSANHPNRMIKVPATPAGLEALEDIAAAGITINVTLMFTLNQYRIARDAIWRGAQRRKDGLKHFKSVYSIFISRSDAYIAKNVSQLSEAASHNVGLLIAKEVWQENHQFWADKKTPLQQEIIFASTGKKLDWQPEDYYPANLAGSDIQTDPPQTIDAVDQSGKTYIRTVDIMPPQNIIDEIHSKVDMHKLEETLLREGTAKFAKPMHGLLDRIAAKRRELAIAK